MFGTNQEFHSMSESLHKVHILQFATTYLVHDSEIAHSSQKHV